MHSGHTLIYTDEKVLPGLVKKLRAEGHDVAELPIFDPANVLRATWRQSKTPTHDLTRAHDEFLASIFELRNQKHRILCTTSDGYRCVELLDTTIRHVIHHRLPLTPLQFVRNNRVVGLDGQHSLSSVLVSREELANSQYFVASHFPSFLAIRQLIATILRARRMQLPNRFGDEHMLAINEAYLEARFQVVSRIVWQILTLLKELEYIDFDVSNLDKKYNLLQDCEVWLFTENLPATSSGLGAYLLSHMRARVCQVNVTAAAETLGVGPDQVQHDLYSMQSKGLVQCRNKTFAQLLHVVELCPTDEMIESIAHIFYGSITKILETREVNRSTTDFIFTGAPCILAALALASDTQLPDGKTACGRCSAVSYSSVSVPKSFPQDPTFVLDSSGHCTWCKHLAGI